MRRLLLLPLAGLATALVVAPGPISGSTTTTAAPTTSAPEELPWPDRRFAPCGALDPDDGVLYAFGGRADDGATHLGDLWALDLGNRPETRPTWRLAAAAGAPSAPPAVRSCAAAWDDAARAIARVRRLERRDPRPGLRAFDPATDHGGSSATPRRAAAARRPAGPASSPSTRRATACSSSGARTARTSTISGRSRWTPCAGRASMRPAPARLAGRPLDGDRHPPRRAVAVRRNPPRRRPRRPLAARPRHRDMERDRSRVRAPGARRHVLARRCRTTRPATGSCSTAAGSRRATSTDARRGSSTISTARRRGARSSPIVNLRRPGSSMSPATTPTRSGSSCSAGAPTAARTRMPSG